jgi:hypothetical protein
MTPQLLTVPSPLRRLLKAFAGVALLVFVALLTPSLLAQGISLNAGFNPATTVLGEPVEFNVIISGTNRNQGNPPLPSADGIQFRYVGPQMSTVINNFQMSVTLTHRFQAIPQKTGDIEVAPIAVQIDGTTYQTPKVTLRVQEPGKNGNPEPNNGAFIDIEFPDRPLYVGENIPVNINLCVPSEIRWKPLRMPEFETDNFTRGPVTQPFQHQQDIGGRAFDIATFRTTLTPIRSGKIKLPPVRSLVTMQTSRRGRSSGGNTFEEIFGNDPFAAAFAGSTSVMAERHLTSKEKTIEVIDLPTSNRPDTFRGAIGRFEIRSTSKPDSVKLGDPVTATVHISGEGNFDRIDLPPLQDAKGWRPYPPSTNFQKADEIARTGTKTFELALVPEEAKTVAPVFVLSYFDPATGTYVTKSSDARRLEVTGAPPPAPEPPPAPTNNRPAENTPPPEDPTASLLKTPSEVKDAAARLLAEGATPALKNAALTAGGLAALGLLIAGLRRSLHRTPRQQAAAKARTAIRALAATKSTGELHDHVVNCLRLLCTARGHASAESLDPAELLRFLKPSSEDAKTLERMLNEYIALRYTGENFSKGAEAAVDSIQAATLARTLERLAR